ADKVERAVDRVGVNLAARVYVQARRERAPVGHRKVVLDSRATLPLGRERRRHPEGNTRGIAAQARVVEVQIAARHIDLQTREWMLLELQLDALDMPVAGVEGQRARQRHPPQRRRVPEGGI